MSESEKEVETDADEAREFIEREQRFKDTLDRYHRAIGIEYDYAFKLKQHSAQQVRELEKKNRLKVVSLDLYDINRYSSATVAGTSVYIDAQPQSPGNSDAEQEEFEDSAVIGRGALEDQVTSVDVGYPRVRRRVVRMGIGARAGAARLDIVEMGPFGREVIPVVVDPRNLTWDAERFAHFNDPLCDELWETVTADYDWVMERSGYDNVDLLEPDNGEERIPISAEPSVPKREDQKCGRRITLKVGWLKNDDSTVEVQSPVALDPAKHYMACDTCGYSEEDLVDTPGYDGTQHPDTMPCPQCGVGPEGQTVSLMHKVGVTHEVGVMRAFSDGRRRVIVAKFCPEAGFLRDGPWPKGLTNFPYMLFVPDPFPLEAMGNSTTFLNMDLQSLKNASLRSGFEQMDRNRDLTLVKENSIWDAQHEPYQFDGSGEPVAYVSTYDDLQGMKQMQGSGLNQAFGMWMSTIDAELSRHRGVGQISADASQIKGMPVGTVARIQETGDVPLDEVIRILREDEEQFFSRWFELICGSWPESRWFYITGKNGQSAFRLFNPARMPGLRVRVHASPSLDMVDKAKIEAAKALQDAPPSVIRLAGKSANLPKEMIDELVQAAQARMGAMSGRPGLPVGSGMDAPPPGMPGLAPGPAGAPPLALAPAGMQ